LGVFKTTDGGRSWRPFNYRLMNLSVDALIISTSGGTLYAGTDGGVFDFRFS
jgi:photosystem II stability/assembly factor-like uncharacterized protein